MGLTKKNFHKVPRHQVTFETSWDDGWHLDMKVAELLKRYNLPGTFYVVCDWVGQEEYLTWEQIKELDKMGFQIGSHTISHPQDLKLLHEEDLHFETQNSKDIIEAVLGHSIKSFCYPRGRYDERVKQYVSVAGYTEARATGMVGVTEVKDSLEKPGTIHVFSGREGYNGNWYDFAVEVIDRAKKNGGYINLWGHSKEIDENLEWARLEKFLSHVKQELHL